MTERAGQHNGCDQRLQCIPMDTPGCGLSSQEEHKRPRIAASGCDYGDGKSPGIRGGF